MPPVNGPFAEIVRRRMSELDVGLRELCRDVELDPSFFSKVLAKKRNPPSEESVLRRIAERLELDPPRLIVAAGRIPREWQRLWAEDALFDAVHALASKGRAPAKRKSTPYSAPAPFRELDEELL